MVIVDPEEVSTTQSEDPFTIHYSKINATEAVLESDSVDPGHPSVRDAVASASSDASEPPQEHRPILSLIHPDLTPPMRETPAGRRVAEFFFPLSSIYFSVWRLLILKPRGFFEDSDSESLSIREIHAKIRILVFPGNTYHELDSEISGSYHVPGSFRIFPTEVCGTGLKTHQYFKAFVRGMYAITIYSNLYPRQVPRFPKQYLDLSGGLELHAYPARLMESKRLTFKMLAPAITPVWSAWKYIANHYQIDFTQLVDSISKFAASEHLTWFEYMFV